MHIFPQRKYIFLFFLIVAIAACQQVQSSSQRLAPLPQDPLVQVYFNHSQSSEYQEPYRQQTRPGDNLEQQIIDAISQAKSTVDVAVQELRLPKISQALAKKHQEGIKVRVILEDNYNRPWSSLTPDEVQKLAPREQAHYQGFVQFADLNQDNKLSQDEINQRDALVILNNAQVPWIDDRADGSAGSNLMHHKFVIVDNRLVIKTSANFTLSDIHGDYTNPSSLGNANNFMQIDSPELAALFTEEFNIMWGDGPGGKPDSRFGLKKPLRSPQTITLGETKITIHFSPTSPTQPWSKSSNGLIGKTLDSATKSIDMALFVFSEQRLSKILETRHQENVPIRALIDSQFAYRYYSEGLDMMGVALSNNCQYDVDNNPWNNPITTVGVPTLAKGDLLHHKFAVIDQQTVIAGSHNWSASANHGNDETVLLIDSPTVAAHYVREFDRLYADARLGVPPSVQQRIADEKKQCPQIEAPTSLIKQVNINTATLEELITLPGVGKQLAQRIINARQQQKFTSLAELTKVPGISTRMTEKWHDYISW
ncbi:phospholipase D-like domain-containing protein [Nostoc sp. CCY0012]|uniref:phospholipase D-like domain-containing protein n=1 Tax=Nostoc sp. CCY0012 TaxID=1056123 RepID=UPI0039C75540